MMTELLRRAVECAQALPPAEQDRLGAWLLDQMLDQVPVEEVDTDGLAAIEELAARSGVEDVATQRPLEDVLREYHTRGGFLSS